MIKALDYGIIVSEFELQLRYNIHFRINTLEKVLPLNYIFFLLISIVIY